MSILPSPPRSTPKQLGVSALLIAILPLLSACDNNGSSSTGPVQPGPGDDNESRIEEPLRPGPQLLHSPPQGPAKVAFVGIAGANKGTSLCLPGSEGNVVSCDEIAKGTAWLDDLNGVDGADETYPPARWLTVYDGTGLGDVAFLTPEYAQSPALKGADNREYPLADHNALRVDPVMVSDYRNFLEQADLNLGGPASPFCQAVQ